MTTSDQQSYGGLPQLVQTATRIELKQRTSGLGTQTRKGETFGASRVPPGVPRNCLERFRSSLFQLQQVLDGGNFRSLRRIGRRRRASTVPRDVPQERRAGPGTPPHRSPFAARAPGCQMSRPPHHCLGCSQCGGTGQRHLRPTEQGQRNRLGKSEDKQARRGSPGRSQIRSIEMSTNDGRETGVLRKSERQEKGLLSWHVEPSVRII